MSKPKKTKPFDEAELQKLRDLWAAFGRHQRARVAPYFKQDDYDEEHGYLMPWPAHIPLEPCIARMLEMAPVYEQATPMAFSEAGQRLANILAFDGSEHLVCDTGKLSKKTALQKASHVQSLGEALAICSCIPGGIKIFGMWFETRDGHTAIRISMPRGDGPADESVGQEIEGAVP